MPDFEKKLNMTHIVDLIYSASETSAAGVELRSLYNALADDFEGQELLARFDSYIDDASADAQDLYRQLKKAQ